MVSRRAVIRNLIVSVGGSSLLSACGSRVALVTLNPSDAPRFYGEREMAVLARVSDLLIPRTDTPGALDVGVPSLLDGLMTDWASRETREEHRAALAAVDAALGARAGGDFLDATGLVAESALAAVDDAAYTGDAVEGYRGLKGLIAQMYFATEGGAVEEQGWVAVPGRWDPCADR